MEGRVLLVAGGYSGVARGDLVAYKVPLFVSSDQGDRVSAEKQNRKSRLLNSWEVCQDTRKIQFSRCLSYAFTRMPFVPRLWMKACV